MSIIVLLKNNLTNICSKISKIEINFWMVHTCNMKSSGKDENGKKVNVLCIVDQNHERSVVVLDYFRNFKGI